MNNGEATYNFISLLRGIQSSTPFSRTPFLPSGKGAKIMYSPSSILLIIRSDRSSTRHDTLLYLRQQRWPLFHILRCMPSYIESERFSF